MFVTRASVGPNGENINSSAPLVDQQQTYGSDQATRFFLMEYDAAGLATGRLVTGANGGMATWADIKANALNRGLVLTDNHVGNIPSIGTPLAYDAQTVDFTVGSVLTGATSGATALIIGNVDGGATGILTLKNIVGIFQDDETITDGAGSASANGTAVPNTYALGVGTGQAFLADIAHTANPAGKTDGYG